MLYISLSATNSVIICGLVNICIVEKNTKFDSDIFLDFRAVNESIAGSTVRLRTA